MVWCVEWCSSGVSPGSSLVRHIYKYNIGSIKCWEYIFVCWRYQIISRNFICWWCSTSTDRYWCSLRLDSVLTPEIPPSEVYCHENFERSIWLSIVWPILECAAPIWNPYIRKHIIALENVQRRATKLIPGLNKMEYEDRLRTLKLPTWHVGDIGVICLKCGKWLIKNMTTE